MICKNCGSEYENTMKNCPACGTENPNVYHAPKHYQPGQNAEYEDSYNRQTQKRVRTVYVNDSEPNYDEHVSVGGWIGRWLLMCIPIVSLVMLFVWAFGGTRKYSLKTWARAQLLLALIFILIIAVAVVIMLVLGVNVADVFKNAQYYG